MNISRINRRVNTQENYEKVIYNSVKFRKSIDGIIKLFPELFPAEIDRGYLMKDIYHSKKQSLPIRRIKVAGKAYTVRPSFMMPYLTGAVDEVEKALFMRKFNVPFWSLSYAFGKDAMYWYRLELSLGRNSIVGTIVKEPEKIPLHLCADEKHTRISGNKVYIATTVGNNCILGAATAKDAGEKSLRDAYGVFAKEARCLKPNYAPETVNTDGWKATQKAWSFLFSGIAVICCFLHVFIKIRNRAAKKHKEIFSEVSMKLWDCYHTENKAAFSQRVRRLVEWCKKRKPPDVIWKPLKKLRENIDAYKIAYDFPTAQRTSNMADRLMQRMNKHLFSTQYFHGSISAAELSIRGWALIQNFAPYNPKTVKRLNGLQSPAENLNRFRYNDNWLQNLLISASLGGY